MSGGVGPAGRLARFFVDSKLTPLLVLASLALGAIAITSTPREEEPQIVVPVIDLFVGLPGASAVEVESRLARPLETLMWQIPGVEYVYSVAQPERAMVTVRFRVGEDGEDSLVKLFDKLAAGMAEMPAGSTPPLARSRSIDDVPVLTLVVSSEERDSDQLRRIAGELGRELSKLPDVSRLELHGGERREISVLLDPTAVAAHGLDLLAVARALAPQDAGGIAGTFERGGRTVRVETSGLLESREEVAALVVALHDGRPVRLSEVAEVIDGPQEASSYVSFGDGQSLSGDDARLRPAVTLSVAKRQGADARHVVTSVLTRLKGLSGDLLPADVEVTVTRDYGHTASRKARELLTHLAFAVLSVTLVIGISLGFRGALVVFVSVPVSFALTLFVYYAFGYTLNRVTLFALVFVTGIVVDDSIIVVENIVRHLGMHRTSRNEASIRAVDEVGNPTILATLTVIASVLPMAFVTGLMGPYMRPMPVGASVAMLFSLAVALVVAPWLARRLVRGEESSAEGDGIEGTRTYRIYRRLVGPLLLDRRRRWMILAAVALSLVAAVATLPLRWVAVKMLPFDDKSEMQVLLDMPEGTPLETTQRVAEELFREVRRAPEVRHVELYAGTPAPINFNGLVRHLDLRQGSNLADLTLVLADKDQRGEQSHPIARRLRPPLAEIARRHGGVVKVVEVPPGPPVLSTLVAEIYGPDDESRLALGEQVRRIFEATPGVVDVDWTVEAPQETLELQVDRQRASLFGITPRAVNDTLRLAVSGMTAGSLHAGREAEPVPIRLRLPRAERSGEDRLAALRLSAPSGALVPLRELLRSSAGEIEPSRHRKNLRPVLYVVGEVAGGAESPIYAILEMGKQIDALRVAGASVEQYYRAAPPDDERVALKWDGEWQITYEVFRDLGVAFGIVLLLMYALLVAWFGSFSVPLVMMLAIPLSLVGILPGHLLFGAFFTATSMIGFIALAGIMVRNSVLLIDFVDLARARGRSLADAVLEAGAVRFRPILLTAGTVVVGAFVILFDPIFQGLAISLLAGTLASTALTLLVVPVVYYQLLHGEEVAESGGGR